MTVSQRAMWAAIELLPDIEKAAQERSRQGLLRATETRRTLRSTSQRSGLRSAAAEAGAKVGVSENAVSRAKYVRTHDPELADAVLAGSVAVTVAAKALRETHGPHKRKSVRRQRAEWDRAYAALTGVLIGCRTFPPTPDDMTADEADTARIQLEAGIRDLRALVATLKEGTQ